MHCMVVVVALQILPCDEQGSSAAAQRNQEYVELKLPCALFSFL